VHQINNPQPQAGGFLFASPGRLVLKINNPQLQYATASVTP
jgi:hypothetical protein